MWTVESVEDTRSYDLETGKAIPGTGDGALCEHCGKAHDVHVHLIDKKAGARKMVGRTCAKKLMGWTPDAPKFCGVCRISARIHERGIPCWHIEISGGRTDDWNRDDHTSEAVAAYYAKIGYRVEVV